MHRSRTSRSPKLFSWLPILLAAVIVVTAVTQSGAQAAAVPVTGGVLDWGIKASFRSYITGPIAHGSIGTSGGATQNPNGTFHYPAGAGGSHDSTTSMTSATFTGAVRFLGHDEGDGPALDMTVSNPRVQLAGNSGTLVVDVHTLDAGKPVEYLSVAFASLNLSGVKPSRVTAAGGSALTWTNVPAALTAAGVAPFGGFYVEGQDLDPLTFMLALGAENTPTPTATSTLPVVNGMTWRVSQNAWTSGSLSSVHEAEPPAIKDPDRGFIFPPGKVTYSPATGATAVDFQGSMTLGNTNFGNFRIRMANPSVTVNAQEIGQLVADVSYCLQTCSTTPVWVGPQRVTVVTFSATRNAVTDTGSQVTWTFTPEYPLQNDPANPLRRQFPQSFLDALDAGLQGFFRDTGSGSDPNKPPAPLTVSFPYSVAHTPTPTATATITATRTTAGTSGGGAFTLANSSGRTALLSWDPGTLQASYALLQLAAGGAAVIPVPGGATATSATADVPLQEALACFQLFAFDGATQLLTASDVDCLLPGFVTGLAPTNFRIRLTQSNTATLAWDGVPGASGYVLVALGTNRAQALPPGTLSTPDPTGGIATCYLLLVQAAGGAPVGLSNMVCGIPGLHLGHAAQSSPSSVARPQAAASDARRPVTGRPVLVPTIPRPSTPEPMPTAVRRRQ